MFKVYDTCIKWFEVKTNVCAWQPADRNNKYRHLYNLNKEYTLQIASYKDKGDLESILDCVKVRMGPGNYLQEKTKSEASSCRGTALPPDDDEYLS